MSEDRSKHHEPKCDNQEEINKPFDPEEGVEKEGFARPAGSGGGNPIQGGNTGGGEPDPGH